MNQHRPSTSSAYFKPLLFGLGLLGVIAAIQAAQGQSTNPPAGRVPAETNAIAGALPDIESAAHGFPELLDSRGKKLADGEFTQWLEDGLLHVTIRYDFGGGHRTEEKAIFRQEPRLVQESWSWSEVENGETTRHFTVDFQSGKMDAEKKTDHQARRWSKNIKVEPGQMFAGFGFALAIKSLQGRLTNGENVELRAVGFTPKPRVVTVQLSYGGLDEMAMGERTVQGGRFRVHPEIPWLLRPFFKVKDTQIWYTTTRPMSFVRSEGPLVEASDPVIRVDLLPGEHSGSAEPAHP